MIADCYEDGGRPSAHPCPKYLAPEYSDWSPGRPGTNKKPQDSKRTPKRTLKQHPGPNTNPKRDPQRQIDAQNESQMDLEMPILQNGSCILDIKDHTLNTKYKYELKSRKGIPEANC